MSTPVMTIEGDVVAVHSHWTNDGSRIVTEATIRPPEGEDVVVRQLGGSVDGDLDDRNHSRWLRQARRLRNADVEWSDSEALVCSV